MVEANRGANAFAQLSMLLNPMAGAYGQMGYAGMAPAMTPVGYPAPGVAAPVAGMPYTAPAAAATQGFAGTPVAGPAPQSFNPTGAPVAPATAGVDRPVGIVEPAATTGDVGKTFKA